MVKHPTPDGSHDGLHRLAWDLIADRMLAVQAAPLERDQCSGLAACVCERCFTARQRSTIRDMLGRAPEVAS